MSMAYISEAWAVLCKLLLLDLSEEIRGKDQRRKIRGYEEIKLYLPKSLS
jgi:hypothetical protein